MHDSKNEIGESVCEGLREGLKTERDRIRWAGEQALVRLAERLYSIRLNRQVSQSWIAKAIGTGQANISDIENADANPTVRTVGRLAGALGIDVADLFKPAPRCRVAEGIVKFVDGYETIASYHVSVLQGPQEQPRTSWPFRNLTATSSSEPEQSGNAEANRMLELAS